MNSILLDKHQDSPEDTIKGAKAPVEPLQKHAFLLEQYHRIIFENNDFFTDLYDNLYKWVFTFTRDHHNTLDIVQDAFLKAEQRIDTFDNSYPLCYERFKSWIFGITRRTLVDRYRHSRKKTISNSLSEGECDALGYSDDFQSKVESQELSVIVQKTLKDFDCKKHTDILKFAYLDDLSYSEIAILLGVPIGTVKSRLHRARSVLGKQLENLL